MKHPCTGYSEDQPSSIRNPAPVVSGCSWHLLCSGGSVPWCSEVNQFCIFSVVSLGKQIMKDDRLNQTARNSCPSFRLCCPILPRWLGFFFCTIKGKTLIIQGMQKLERRSRGRTQLIALSVGAERRFAVLTDKAQVW